MDYVTLPNILLCFAYYLLKFHKHNMALCLNTRNNYWLPHAVLSNTQAMDYIDLTSKVADPGIMGRKCQVIVGKYPLTMSTKKRSIYVPLKAAIDRKESWNNACDERFLEVQFTHTRIIRHFEKEYNVDKFRIAYRCTGTVDMFLLGKKNFSQFELHTKFQISYCID